MGLDKGLKKKKKKQHTKNNRLKEMLDDPVWNYRSSAAIGESWG